MIVITASGVKVLVEYCRTVQARAFLQEQLFQEYRCVCVRVQTSLCSIPFPLTRLLLGRVHPSSFSPEEGSQDVAEFRIDLKILLVRPGRAPAHSPAAVVKPALRLHSCQRFQECLSIFGTGDHVAMRIAYEGYGYPLNIVYVCQRGAKRGGSPQASLFFSPPSFHATSISPPHLLQPRRQRRHHRLQHKDVGARGVA